GKALVVNEKGGLIYPFQESSALNKNICCALDLGEILDRENKWNTVIHYESDEKQFPVLVAAHRIINPYLEVNNIEWIVFVRENLSEVMESLNSVGYLILIITIICLVLLVLLTVFFSHRFVNPIKQLERGIARIGDGDFDFRVNIKTGDEMENLANSVNYMARNLKESTTSLDNLNREIVEREKSETALRTSEEKYRIIFESSKDAIMLLEPGSTFLAGNPTAVEMFGCIDEVSFMSFTLVDLSPEYQPDGRSSLEKAEQMIKLALEKGSNFFEWTHKRINGEEFFASVLLNRLELEGKTVLQATVRDISDQKKAEEAVRKAAALKSQFTSMVSHELRTPLGPIKEGASIILDGLTGEINEQQRDLLETVKRSAERLNRLINDVLDFQKLELGKMEFRLEDNDINDLIVEVHKTMGLAAKNKGLDIVIDSDQDIPVIKFDKDRINQVLTNLLNNAIKFTDTGTVTVRTKIEGNIVHIMVEDTGLGIKEEDIPKLFESFQQLLMPRERTVGGTGLGLAISKEIITQHKGKIWVESVFGKGSVFHFVLPINERRR
ncbi:MAG: ATP-binding protein, partial [Candidatus Omnitrophota bacterium]